MFTECVKNVTIQYNEICRNTFDAAASDMCGVDLDNGTCNSIVQYNYIHDMVDAMFEIITLGNTDFNAYNIILGIISLGIILARTIKEGE